MSPSRPQVDCSELKLLHNPTRLASSALGITLKPRQAGGQGTKGQARFPVLKIGVIFSNFLEGGGIRPGGERSWTRQADHFSTLGSPCLAPRTLGLVPRSLLLPRRSAEAALTLGKSCRRGSALASETAGSSTSGRLARLPPPRLPLCPRTPALPLDYATCLQGDLLKQSPWPAPGRNSSCLVL